MNEATMCVMIIDDDISCLQSLKDALALNGFRVIEFASPAQALQRFTPPNTAGVDVVITDYRFPGAINGIQLMTEIKKINPNAPVIIISGATNTTLPDRCLAAGAAAFLSKPIDVGALIEKLEALNAA